MRSRPSRPASVTTAADTLSFPKTMRWGPERRFARPIRWVVALFGSDVLNLEYAGVRAGDTTRGLRFWEPGPHKVTGAEGYETTLKKGLVIADHARRREIIATETERAARAESKALIAAAHDEAERLLEETRKAARDDEKSLRAAAAAEAEAEAAALVADSKAGVADVKASAERRVEDGIKKVLEHVTAGAVRARG